MLPTMPSAMTLGSTGSATLFTSTESFEDSPLRGRNTGVFVERDICTTRQGHREGLPGRGTTLSLFGATGDCRDDAGFVIVILVCRIFCSFIEIDVSEVEHGYFCYTMSSLKVVILITYLASCYLSFWIYVGRYSYTIVEMPLLFQCCH